MFLIEDCAHALGTTYDNKHVGTFGSSGCFSFYPTKQIAIGEGGMVITNDAKFGAFISQYKAFGIDVPPEDRKIPGKYDVKGLGYNYRMTDYQSAIGLGQLTRYAQNSNEET
ncbi:MAG: DegT/DnrJ/EryC1/StrS family aminotransferase [Bacteriovoracaceae bacterium]